MVLVLRDWVHFDIIIHSLLAYSRTRIRKLDIYETAGRKIENSFKENLCKIVTAL